MPTPARLAPSYPLNHTQNDTSIPLLLPLHTNMRPRKVLYLEGGALSANPTQALHLR